MPAVDRNVLRIGAWELLWADDVPDGVAISEAVALAQDLSTDGSPAFVNGLLARAKTLRPAVAARRNEGVATGEARQPPAVLPSVVAGPASEEAATTGDFTAQDSVPVPAQPARAARS